MAAVKCCCCDSVEDKRNMIKILNEENEYSANNLYRLKCASQFKRTHLTDKHRDQFLTMDSLIRINNLITISTNFRLRTVNVRPAGSDKEYMDFHKIEPAFQGLIDVFNCGKIRPKTFVEAFIKIHPFLEGNGRTCKVLFI